MLTGEIEELGTSERDGSLVCHDIGGRMWLGSLNLYQEVGPKFDARFGSVPPASSDRRRRKICSRWESLGDVEHAS